MPFRTVPIGALVAVAVLALAGTACLTAEATDAADNNSARVTHPFRIVK